MVMNIKDLTLKNVGPFKEIHLDFPCTPNASGQLPVTLVTGENGTGKSIIIDSLRMLFKGLWGIDRNIVADQNDFKMSMTLNVAGQDKIIESTKFKEENGQYKLQTNDYEYSKSFSSLDGQPTKDYVLDYWSPDLAMDKFEIKSLNIIKADKPLETSFERVFNNNDIYQFICWADYLRGSQNSTERNVGEVLYSKLSNMITDCLAVGEFKYVSRTNLKPIVAVRGKELSIEKLSMGNLLILTHLVRTLYRAYGICSLNHRPITQIDKIDGVLLIDEIENHLHPKWQKKVIGLIQRYFPKFQLIITTHSPFVISSVDNPKIFVCESMDDYSQISDISYNYANMPVDEVLRSQVFGVGPFGEKISKLMSERDMAMQKGNDELKKEIEHKLLQINQAYFSFYQLGEQLGLN